MTTWIVMHGTEEVAQVNTSGQCEIYAVNHDIDVMQYILQLDAYSFYMMNIVDYLVGNTDRHIGNWGFLVDNYTNKPMRLYELMDFNKAFQRYDTLEGANSLTTRHRSQQEAAMEAVKQIGLNQKREIEEAWFLENEITGNEKQSEKYQMFLKRLMLLKQIESETKGERKI